MKPKEIGRDGTGYRKVDDQKVGDRVKIIENSKSARRENYLFLSLVR
jgi:hypothetical protein